MVALKGAGNSTFTFNSNALTAYMNQMDLQMVAAELEATDLASTGMESDPDLTKFTISMGGDWSPTLDGYLGPDAMTSVKRTGVFTVDDGSTTVTYTWTTNAFITNYSINPQTPGKITWSATMNLSGLPSRGTA